ncbi:ABC transporter substrate-binding protein [Microbacterium sp. NPDC058342]|uniref:ABC transporter substrate-binding protein n=1 Tax=Microbacterium sp. NPDC058342 TaxID=3346454 RepID=UPI003660A5E6
MRSRNRVVALATSALLLGALTACGTNLQADKGDDAASLVYWGKWAEGTPQATLFESIIADYKKETGVEVEVQWLGDGEEEQVKNAIATGEGPDFYDTAIDHTAQFRAAGALGDMAPFFDAEIPGEDKTIGDVIPESVIGAISDDEGPGFVPHSVFSVGLWFDAAAQPELDSAPPKTFADFLSAAQKIKASSGHQPIALDGTINSYNAFWTYQLLLSTAGPGVILDLADDPDAWQDPAVREGLDALQQLVDADLFQPDYMATKFPDAQNAWAGGEHAFNLNGTWLASETAPVRADGIQPRIMALPPVTATEDQVVTIGALGWGVNPDSKNQDEVAEFLGFAMQKKYIDRIATDADNIPSRIDSPAPEALATIQQQIADATSSSLDFDGIATVNPEWWNDVFLPLNDKLIGGSLTVDQFVAEGADQTRTLAGE